jgi:hypothetical protein
MPSPIQLHAEPESDQRTVRFYAVFPAPAIDAVAECNPAKLFTGDPQTGIERTIIVEAAALCAPSAATWTEQRKQLLGATTYASPGIHQATLRWGDTIATASFDLGTEHPIPRPSLPILTLFEIKPAPDQTAEAVIRVQLTGLAPEQEARINAGADQLFALFGKDGPDAHGEWSVSYDKPGEYVVAVDVLDADGYWLATLGQNPIEIAWEDEEPAFTSEPEPGSPAVALEPLIEVPTAAESDPPWLPYRYIRPMWGGINTYRTPGGGTISRTLVLGTYLAVRMELMIGNAVWYQSTYGDWIAGSAVAHVQPSALRGVELRDGPPPPPPPPGGIRHGIVTAALLNVRARPGVSPDNPPIAQLPNGAAVTIYEEQSVAGTPWYRIGDNRWVCGLYVRIVEEPPPPQARRGIVTASVLNVRARPGVSPDNPVIDQLVQGTEVSIYEEQPVAGVAWYRIGTNRWVHSAYVRLIQLEAARELLNAPTDVARLPVGWVVASSLNVRARPGVSAGNPVIGEVFHNQRLDILESTTVGDARWYRIGADRWVIGQWVAAATPKARPASIGASERWVGVNLSQQSLVAYEGDTPVYAAMVATGVPATPTVRGVFRTWLRRPGGRMSGGAGSGYYYLEEVTWTCFFYSGYALHTAYWHDAFGRPRSHGCVNLSPYDAWWVYQWSAPGGAHSPAVYVYGS